MKYLIEQSFSIYIIRARGIHNYNVQQTYLSQFYKPKVTVKTMRPNTPLQQDSTYLARPPRHSIGGPRPSLPPSTHPTNQPAHTKKQ